MEQVNLSVGTGYSPDRQNSFLESTFYENTINLRKELVSKTICPSKMLSWFKNRMNSLKLKNANILLLSGKDDLIAGREGPERLSKLLTEKGNFVTLNRPKKFATSSTRKCNSFSVFIFKKTSVSLNFLEVPNALILKKLVATKFFLKFSITHFSNS